MGARDSAAMLFPLISKYRSTVEWIGGAELPSLIFFLITTQHSIDTHSSTPLLVKTKHIIRHTATRSHNTYKILKREASKLEIDE